MTGGLDFRGQMVCWEVWELSLCPALCPDNTLSLNWEMLSNVSLSTWMYHVCGISEEEETSTAQIHCSCCVVPIEAEHHGLCRSY